MIKSAVFVYIRKKSFRLVDTEFPLYKKKRNARDIHAKIILSVCLKEGIQDTHYTEKCSAALQFVNK